MTNYIYQQDSWPNFAWNHESIQALLGKVRNMQGRLLGRMESLSLKLQNEAILETLSLDVLKSSEIAGEIKNPEQVRSSLACKLGLDTPDIAITDREVDGIVKIKLDATQHYSESLTKERLFSWHFAMFPYGTNGIYNITVGSWRDDPIGSIRIASGALEEGKVHYEAPASEKIESEMTTFIGWFNTEENLDPVIKSALAHLWFLSLHPFEDANGIMARSLSDMLLARGDESPKQFYSMSAQICLEQNEYYNILEKTQKSTLDVTDWLQWFLNCLSNSLVAANENLSRVLKKHQFWNAHATDILNKRQILLLNRLMSGFEGKLTSSVWAKVTKCSTDTALRDIQDLINKQILRKEPGGGRSTSYEINE